MWREVGKGELVPEEQEIVERSYRWRGRSCEGHCLACKRESGQIPGRIPPCNRALGRRQQVVHHVFYHKELCGEYQEREATSTTMRLPSSRPAAPHPGQEVYPDAERRQSRPSLSESTSSLQYEKVYVESSSPGQCLLDVVIGLSVFSTGFDDHFLREGRDDPRDWRLSTIPGRDRGNQRRHRRAHLLDRGSRTTTASNGSWASFPISSQVSSGSIHQRTRQSTTTTTTTGVFMMFVRR